MNIITRDSVVRMIIIWCPESSFFIMFNGTVSKYPATNIEILSSWNAWSYIEITWLREGGSNVSPPDTRSRQKTLDKHLRKFLTQQQDIVIKMLLSLICMLLPTFAKSVEVHEVLGSTFETNFSLPPIHCHQKLLHPKLNTLLIVWCHPFCQRFWGFISPLTFSST